MDKKNILLIVGSFRKNSFNQSLADYIAEILKNEANVEFLNYRNLPILEQDIEYPAPEQVIDIRNQVRKADALWVVSPEYNGSYPALLKQGNSYGYCRKTCYSKCSCRYYRRKICQGKLVSPVQLHTYESYARKWSRYNITYGSLADRGTDTY